MGTKACQEDVQFAPDAKASGTPSATPTPTSTPDDEGEDPTPTPTAKVSPSPSATVSVTPTPTATPAAASAPGGLGSAIIDSLLAIEGQQGRGGDAANWLGDQESQLTVDTDNDGYTDVLEKKYRADSEDPASVPGITTTSRLNIRFVGRDDDLDGLTNEREKQIGSSPANTDSDGDGVSDGAEDLSLTSPILNDSRPVDIDKDGLSDIFEEEAGTNPNSPDTDRDGLKDDIEFALSANPLENDTDQDGILDGKEVQLGSDPTVADNI